MDGRPFVNATIFRHLAFKLPGSPAPRFMLDMVPPEEEQAWQRSFAVMPNPGVYASILRESLRERRWRRFHWNPLTNPRRWQDFDDQLLDALPRLLRSPVSLRDALRTLHEQREWIIEYVGIHVMSLLYANVGYQGMDSLLASWLPQRRTHVLPRLATCPPGNETVATNAALNRLADRSTDPAATVQVNAYGLNNTGSTSLNATYQDLFSNQIFDNSSSNWSYAHNTIHSLQDLNL